VRCGRGLSARALMHFARRWENGWVYDGYTNIEQRGCGAGLSVATTLAWDMPE